METVKTMEKRNVEVAKKKGLSARDILLIGILLAAGLVLKVFVGQVINIGMKPNFIIAMYCLIILLIKPRFVEALIIGLLAGAISQIAPAAPFINLVSEPVGAIVMYLLCKIPMTIKKFSLQPIVNTFIGTLASGLTFMGILYVAFFLGAGVKVPQTLVAALILVGGTAVANVVIVQLLHIPLGLALRTKK